MVVYRGEQAAFGFVPRNGRSRVLPMEAPELDAKAPAAHGVQVNSTFEDSFSRAHLCFEKQQAKLAESLRFTPFAERAANPRAGTRTRMSGRERLTTIRRVLDSFGLERSDMQKQFHEDMIGACARLIFPDDLQSEIDDLLLELNVDELHSEFMAITPRRFGKTYSVAMFVVAMMYAVPGVEQAIFSTGRRASQKLLELVYRLLCKIPGMRESIVKHNVETIWIRGPDGDERKVFSYPSNVKISALSLFLFLCVWKVESGGGECWRRRVLW